MTEVIFPARLIPTLKTERGKEWQDLIETISAEDADFIDTVAIVSLIARLCSCQSCSFDSFRAMRGCLLCAQLAIRRVKVNDSELIAQFRQSRCEMDKFIQKQYRSEQE